MHLWPASRQAARCASRYRVQLLVLRDAPQEWTPPQDIEIVRSGGIDVQARLEYLGGAIAAGTNPVVRCHLLAKEERLALARATRACRARLALCGLPRHLWRVHGPRRNALPASGYCAGRTARRCSLRAAAGLRCECIPVPSRYRRLPQYVVTGSDTTILNFFSKP